MHKFVVVGIFGIVNANWKNNGQKRRLELKSLDFLTKIHLKGKNHENIYGSSDYETMMAFSDCVTSLSPDINLHFLLTVLRIFLMVLVARIWSDIKTFHHRWSFQFIAMIWKFHQALILQGQVRFWSLVELKGTKQERLHLKKNIASRWITPLWVSQYNIVAASSSFNNGLSSLLIPCVNK